MVSADCVDVVLVWLFKGFAVSDCWPGLLLSLNCGREAWFLLLMLFILLVRFELMLFDFVVCAGT